MAAATRQGRSGGCAQQGQAGCEHQCALAWQGLAAADIGGMGSDNGKKPEQHVISTIFNALFRRLLVLIFFVVVFLVWAYLKGTRVALGGVEIFSGEDFTQYDPKLKRAAGTGA